MTEPESPGSPGAPESKAALDQQLLHGEAASVERRPVSPWAYPMWGILVVSFFVAYHVLVLLVYNTPGKGLAKDFHRTFMTEVKGTEYIRGTRNNQSWAMFAPNPNRSNSFVRVFVEDQDGELWDFEQDIWGENRYPYIWYDRRGKINRRIDGKKHYQRIYGAWVCREWERQHEGVPAKSVTFVKRWTRVPHAKEVIERGGWSQWEAPFKQIEQETITCKTVAHGQLNNELRARYGFAPLENEDEVFRPVKSRTWWDQLEVERKREEREANRAEARVKLQTKREERLGKASSSDTQPVPLDARGPVRQPDEPAPSEDDSPDDSPDY